MHSGVVKLKKLGAGSCNFPTAKLALKSITVSCFELSYCKRIKIIWNLLAYTTSVWVKKFQFKTLSDTILALFYTVQLRKFTDKETIINGQAKNRETTAPLRIAPFPPACHDATVDGGWIQQPSIRMARVTMVTNDCIKMLLCRRITHQSVNKHVTNQSNNQ